MKMKTMITAIISFFITVLAALGVNLRFTSANITFDAAKLTGTVTSGASGYLYGVSEEGVPSANMTESLKVSSVSAKVLYGLQHPIGEVSHVAPQLTKDESFDYMIVYLQDIYKTWYYDDANITEMKKNGTYDYKDYLENTFFPMIKDSITDMLKSDYADKLVFCLINECDNGVWFGHWDEEHQWNVFDESDFDTFNNGWKMVYDYVKSLAPDVLIGGPGHYDYQHNKMDSFLSFASKNNCAPDILIYHELNDYSIYNWEADVKDLHEVEKKYGISTDTPVIVTEYGRMQDNGNPNTMLKYITKIENTKVYANQAFWLMANNLCNTCADYNTPNSAWWAYRWYADLDGQTMSVKVNDVFHSDLGKALKEKRELRYKQYLGVGSLSESKDRIQLLLSGADYSATATIKNLHKTNLYNKRVKVTISQVTYQGISGKVYQPEIVRSYTTRCGLSMTVPMLNMNSNTAYRVEIVPCDEKEDIFINDNLFERYEFEDGTLLGDAYTYRSAYATTGQENGMVGGMEKDGDGVELSFNVPQDGEYELRFIFGKANDGSKPDDRTFAKVNFSLDGNEEVITLQNTVRSEITDARSMFLSLKKGRHTVRFTHKEGTCVLDSMLIRKAEKQSIYFEKDGVRENAYLIVSPEDGYYDISTKEASAILVDGARTQTDPDATVYLRRGLNYIDVLTETDLVSVCESEKEAQSIVLAPSQAVLSGGAELKESEAAKKKYITGISSIGGEAKYTVTAPESGTYKLTMMYSNNLENGVHVYNVDLVEGYITISVNGEKQQNLYCRNTYSNDTFITVTTNIELSEGENEITLSNDGALLFDNNTAYAPNIAEITINNTAV